MGFFDWVMHGLGFEETETKEKKSKKEKRSKNVEEDKYANFNLHERVEGNSVQSTSSNASNLGGFGIQANSNIIMVEPRSFHLNNLCLL